MICTSCYLDKLNIILTELKICKNNENDAKKNLKKYKKIIKNYI